MNHDEGLMRLAALIQEQRNDDAAQACQTLASNGETLARTQAAHQQRYTQAQREAQKAFAEALSDNQRTYTAAREANRVAQAHALQALELERLAVNGQQQDASSTMVQVIARHRVIKEQNKQANMAALADCKQANEAAFGDLKRAHQAAWMEFQTASREALQQFTACEQVIASEMVQKATERCELVRSVLKRCPTTLATTTTMGH